jgi:hypothetical protein
VRGPPLLDINQTPAFNFTDPEPVPDESTDGLVSRMLKK